MVRLLVYFTKRLGDDLEQESRTGAYCFSHTVRTLTLLWFMFYKRARLPNTCERTVKVRLSKSYGCRGWVKSCKPEAWEKDGDFILQNDWCALIDNFLQSCYTYNQVSNRLKLSLCFFFLLAKFSVGLCLFFRIRAHSPRMHMMLLSRRRMWNVNSI